MYSLEWNILYFVSSITVVCACQSKWTRSQHWLMNRYLEHFLYFRLPASECLKTSENHCRIASRVTKKSLFTVANVLFYFLHAILCHEHTNPLRTIIERSFRHCCQGRPFLTEHCDVTTIDLWRHENAKNWYCEVIFVDCHYTRKLAQRRSSLVNNSREYRYLATRYSRLSV